MKIHIAGDSLGMPRPFRMNNKIELHYEECYPELLRRMLQQHYGDRDIILVNQCQRANNSLSLLRNVQMHRYGEIYLSRPDVLVLQVGSVDSFERDKHHDDFVPLPELKGRNPWIPGNEFMYNMGEIIKSAVVIVPDLKGIVIVNIPPIEKSERPKNKLTRERISEYNRLLKMLGGNQNIFVADVYRAFYKSSVSNESPFSSDGVHPNQLGSQLTAKAICDLITEKIITDV